MKRVKWAVRALFGAVFVTAVVYIGFVETERYESKSVVLLKDLEKKQSMDLGSLLIGQSSNVMRDSKVLEIYIRSHEMFRRIDADYNLSAYYTGDELDVLQRLYRRPIVSYFKATRENIMRRYNEDLHAVYDDASGTLALSFVHADARRAQQILQDIIRYSEETINKFARENAEIALRFFEKQRILKRKRFVEAIKKLIAYQNRHLTIDPSVDVERKITIIAELESELVKNEVEYATKLKTFNPNSREMQMLNRTIRNIKGSIARLKKELAGKSDGKHSELNANVFAFELLKSDMEFAKEVYRQTLINQERFKMEVAQQSKHLVVIARPTLPDDYAYPNKWWDILTVFAVLLFLYGIVTAVIAIIANHKD